MAKKRVLVVDDEKDFTKLVKSNLEKTGNYDVWTENLGSRALGAAKQFHPDIIFLDIIMPDMDGGDVAKQIQEDNLVSDIPIVFITAATTKDEVYSTRGVIGGHPFRAKPVTTEELINCIEDYVV